jgi:predicted MPP superfamily phosphohydrolase
LAVLADLHGCSYGEGQRELLDAVSKVQPDAVLMLGDIVDDVMPEKNAWTTVSALSEEYPCYYVTGNHEWWSGEVERICADMAVTGVNVLQGDCRSIGVNGNTITFCGVDDPDSDVYESHLKRVCDQITEEGFHVLLAHRPERIEEYLECPFDLILSGHAHGGQFRLPFIGGLFAPNQGFFPKYDAGLYTTDDTKMIVSRGVGNSIFPLRINNPPEIILIELKNEPIS